MIFGIVPDTSHTTCDDRQQGMTLNTHWANALDGWQSHLAASKRPETVRQRCYQLRRAAHDLGGTPATVTTADLDAWLSSRGWGPNTRRSFRTALREFYRWAVDEGIVARSPAHRLEPVKVPRGRPRPAPDPVYRNALAVADDRVRMAIELAGHCGLRRGEVARVRREDLEQELVGWSLRVTGKGGHVRLVPLPDHLAEQLLAREPGWVFPSPRRPGPLTAHHLGKLVSRHLAGHTTHALRHRCGTVAYAGHRDIRAVQELLGHASVTTTQLYVDPGRESVRAAMLAAA